MDTPLFIKFRTREDNLSMKSTASARVVVLNKIRQVGRACRFYRIWVAEAKFKNGPLGFETPADLTNLAASLAAKNLLSLKQFTAFF